MRIKEIIEHYKDLKKWVEPICFKEVSTVIIRGLIEEISSIEDELITKFGDIRISLKNDLYLKYIFYDLDILKSELYIVMLERDGQDFSFWTDWKEKNKVSRLRYLGELRNIGLDVSRETWRYKNEK